MLHRSLSTGTTRLPVFGTLHVLDLARSRPVLVLVQLYSCTGTVVELHRVHVLGIPTAV